jgi:uncharacterized protein with PIN domain
MPSRGSEAIMERDPQQNQRLHASDEAPQRGQPDMPRCPKCGWQDVRLSHSKGVVHAALRMLSVCVFRCRSCGARFYRFHRRRSEEN